MGLGGFPEGGGRGWGERIRGVGRRGGNPGRGTVPPQGRHEPLTARPAAQIVLSQLADCLGQGRFNP